ncbi:cell division protein DamX [Salmonella enterica subsp. enterica serovar Wilhelmsburg]|uniref:Cell division protein DamX n=1 Tax=Salmonella enterica subsp. enterica serovar Wilhelmsburg TaxID=1960126 RepID=A0A659N7W4_SALET|nr:cell division protein DamX [Salmonella enterica]TGC51152.1 cell division protein DamX [Salmonella enterica subsp. enterica serovar Wilhelmsburg]TGC54378.1 cell division protein DamX [Salmonella enterica subsp. enterica serovar Wilhelmsburg]TGC60435.1 cell division protein DamX [Salmonella enterica subsp. enterica serovar Wilhelmsburg]TGC68894.1 cell division protein DamX [Salmonella enterica subsp. enterica serovar Wilhelmsburg]TGC88442.1 cell division protein DamX [Salmonella enterica subs
MDEFKPEDELKPDPSDRRTGRSRQSSERDNEPQINFDDVDLDADDRRPTRTRKARSEEPEVEEEYESDEDDTVDEERVERRPRKRKKAAHKPASRQYMMMGVGVLVLLLLIIGIGSALKAPSTSSSEPSASGEKSIDLSGNAADQANATQPAPGATSAEQTAGNTSQDISLPPISSTPTQGQSPVVADGQQRVEVQGDLNNALTQNPEQMNNVAVNSTLPTEPATVAPVRNGSTTRQAAVSEPAERHTTRPERKQAVIEPKKPQTTAKTTTAEPKKPVAPVKRTEPAAPTATPKATTTTAAPTATASAAPVQTTKPAQASTTPVAGGGKSAGNVGALKSAPSSHYTLQLSSSSNYDNLNGWAKKENLKNYVVYETTRNGQPWYVLVTGMYASKEDAKRAVSTLPADVQAKNPWAKPLHQVQADLK